MLLMLFHRRTIFKILALEQWAEKWPFSAWGGGRPTAPTPPPLATGLFCSDNTALQLSHSKASTQLQ